jgi:hypothetical protein
MTGASQACAVAAVNAIDMLLDYERDHPGSTRRAVDDLSFTQRCVHEALRLRPNTPRPKRHAEVATRIGGRPIPGDATVVINVACANVDRAVFGESAGDFDPERKLPEGVPRWGLSFGSGAHQCPGRTLAGGFPATQEAGADHLFGLVPLVVRELLRRGVRRDPEREAVRESRTERVNAWLSYPAILSRAG